MSFTAVTGTSTSYPPLIPASTASGMTLSSSVVSSKSLPSASEPSGLSLQESLAHKALVLDKKAEEKAHAKFSSPTSGLPTKLLGDPLKLFCYFHGPHAFLPKPSVVRQILKDFSIEELMAIVAKLSIKPDTFFSVNYFGKYIDSLEAEKAKATRSVNRDPKFASIRDLQEEIFTEMMIACVDRPELPTALIKASILAPTKAGSKVSAYLAAMSSNGWKTEQIDPVWNRHEARMFFTHVITMLLVKVGRELSLDDNNNVKEADGPTQARVVSNIMDFLKAMQ